MKATNLLFSLLWCSTVFATAQEMHDHGVPERLGTVSFPISCAPGVQAHFDRSVALLHSFAYPAATKGFQEVAAQDPACAMAHWGEAMSYFHQVWGQPFLASTFPLGQSAIAAAQTLGSPSLREREFVDALSAMYTSGDERTYHARTEAYQQGMAKVAAANRGDVEAQVFSALALLASAPPGDMTHGNQKIAIGVLEPLYRAFPDHPGIAHYLIHACDSQELAAKGLPAARAYALIAPSAPHALHMPSHIFTRLGLWDDSIQSNLASRHAAHEQGDTQQELHAMDYLVYAYLQTGRDTEAEQTIAALRAMPIPDMSNFTVAYAATAMPIRYAVERGRWSDAASAAPFPKAPPEVAAVSVWARGMGLAHGGHPVEARAEADRLRYIAEGLRLAGNEYWSRQTSVLSGEVMAWAAQASGYPAQALVLLRASADQEDALEKLPVTPGPVLPAREQLGALLLAGGQPAAAAREFRSSLANAPGRAGALQGIAAADKAAREAGAQASGRVEDRGK